MEEQPNYNALKLENQICFPLYAASRLVVRRYRPYLEALDLTYTQYIAMMVLWDRNRTSAKELGEALFLDSGTLTPVIKSLEAKGYVRRYRSPEDERVLIVELTDRGRALRDEALPIPGQMGACVKLSGADAVELYRLLYQLLDELKETET